MYRDEKTSMAKIAVIYTVANIITRGMAFLTTPIFSRLMSTEEYGQFSNISSWVNILMIIASADLVSSISRAKYDFAMELEKYLSSIMILCNLITVCLYGIVEVNMDYFEQMFSIDRIYIRFIFIYLMFQPASQFMQKKSQVYCQYKAVVAISSISLLASVGSSAVLVLLMSNKLLARVIGNYLVVAVIGVILWGYILFRGKSFSRKYCVYGLRLSTPLILHNLSGNLLGSSDRIIINRICGSHDAALYSLAYTIATIVGLIMQSLNQAYAPWLYDRLYNGEVEMVRKSSVRYIGIFSLFAIWVMLIAPEIVLIFGGREYYEARFVIALVVMGVVLQFIYTLYVNIELFHKNTIMISLGTFLAAIINIFLNYICIPRWGYIAAAYTTVVGYVFLVFFHFLTVMWKCRPHAHIYNGRAIVGCVLLLSGVTVICMILYKYLLLRYIAIAIYLLIIGILVYAKRDIIRKILTKQKRYPD